MHSAQGRTVDTAHVVATTATTLPALYVGMTRGRVANVAHVVTRRAVADAPTGETATALARSPIGVLAPAFEAANDAHATDRASATAVLEQSAARAESLQGLVEVFADGVEVATAGRVTRWLDTLTTTGHLTTTQRTAIAAEDGAATLGRVLRRAELAGHDPHQVLVDAVTTRSLDDARELTNVVHHRIATAVDLTPTGDTAHAWVPGGISPEDHVYLTTLAGLIEQRRAALAEQTTTAAITTAVPGWAVAALGPVPAEENARAEWSTRVAAMAAHRELSGWDDDTTPIGPAPASGQVEQSASWHTAWRALGSPEEAQLSDGRLLTRVRAYEREEAWGPDYVAEQLAGTRQAAADQRETANLRAAQAAAAAAEDVELVARLQQEADDAAALADTLDARATELADVDHARAYWLAHTAETRARAEAARAELTARHPDGYTDQRVTADEWLAAHHADQAAEDPHRLITADHDLTDYGVADHATERARGTTAPSVTSRRAGEAADRPTPDPVTVRADEVRAVPVVEADVVAPDLRDIAAAEPARPADDSTRVPTAAESADAVRHAQRALAEITQRAAEDARRETEAARADQLTRWHTDDHQTVTEPATAAAAGHAEPALTRD